MNEVFYWLMNMSITATLMGCLVLLLRRLPRLPRRAAAVLWLAPWLRLCVPVGLGSPYSLMALLSRLTARSTRWGIL